MKTTSEMSEIRHWARGKRSKWFLLVAALLVLAGCSSDDDSAGGNSSGGEPAPDVPTIEVDVEMVEFEFSPSTIEVEPGTAVTITVTNAGVMEHDLKVNGEDGSGMVQPGESETFTVGPFTESTEAWCTVVGHRESGMVLDFAVTG